MAGEKFSDLLGVFQAVVDAGSFSEAGRSLNMSPAWVAKQVTRLEETLDSALLIRSTRALRLTEAGQECYRTAGIVVEEISGLKDRVHLKSNKMVGTIRIDVPSIIAYDLVSPHLAAFQRTYPNLRVEITVLDRFVDVLNDEVDIVFRVTEALADSSVISQKIGLVRRVLCASKEYLESAREIRSVRDLTNHKGLMFSGLRSSSRWMLRKDGVEEWVSPDICIEANNSFVLKQAAVDGAGIAFLPEVIVRTELKNGRLVPLAAFEDAAPLSVFLLRAPQRHLPTRVGTAWQYFAKKVKAG